jgi:hypothetical protein
MRNNDRERLGVMECKGMFTYILICTKGEDVLMALFPIELHGIVHAEIMQ